MPPWSCVVSSVSPVRGVIDPAGAPRPPPNGGLCVTRCGQPPGPFSGAATRPCGGPRNGALARLRRAADVAHAALEAGERRLVLEMEQEQQLDRRLTGGERDRRRVVARLCRLVDCRQDLACRSRATLHPAGSSSRRRTPRRRSAGRVPAAPCRRTPARAGRRACRSRRSRSTSCADAGASAARERFHRTDESRGRP